jgi:hypothetical protein
VGRCLMLVGGGVCTECQQGGSSVDHDSEQRKRLVSIAGYCAMAMPYVGTLTYLGLATRYLVRGIITIKNLTRRERARISPSSRAHP